MTSGSGRNALTEQVDTIVAAPRSSRCGRASRVMRTAARRLTASDSVHSASVTLRNPPGRGWPPPTLLTSTSRPPYVVTASSTSRPGPSSLVRSTWTGRTDRPAASAASSSVERPGAGHHLRALVDQRPGHREPDALAGAGHDGHLAGQLQVHASRRYPLRGGGEPPCGGRTRRPSRRRAAAASVTTWCRDPPGPTRPGSGCCQGSGCCATTSGPGCAPTPSPA